MQNTKLILASIAFTALTSLAGCSFPGVYKIDIQQGNVVTQDMINQLRPGMSRAQVRYVMGDPLINDPFNPNRWDYVYSIQTGDSARRQDRATLIFNESAPLISLNGDFMPGVSRDESILGVGKTPGAITEVEVTETVKQSTAKEEPYQPTVTPVPTPGSLLEQLQREVDEVETVETPTIDPID